MSPLARDRAAHHDWLVSLVSLPAGSVLIDLGCGRGADLQRLAASCHDESVRFIGIDNSDAAEDAVRRLAVDEPRIEFRREQLGTQLPFDDGSIDVVFSHNLLECLPDPQSHASEIARILRPGGQVIVGHWDWDTQLYDAPDKVLVRRLVAAFADWQQAWMAHADGWLGRRLWGTFSAIAQFDGEVVARVLTNTVFEPPWFGYENACAMGGLVRRGLIASDDYENFMAAQVALHAEGRYFYSITGYAYTGRRRPSNDSPEQAVRPTALPRPDLRPGPPAAQPRR